MRPAAQAPGVGGAVAVQIQIGEAALKLKTAQSHVYDAADELDAMAARGVQASYATRAEVRGRAGYAAALVVDAINSLLNVHGYMLPSGDARQAISDDLRALIVELLLSTPKVL